MTRRRGLAIGVAIAFAVLSGWIGVLATGDNLTYTMTVDSDVSAGVRQTSSCTIVESRPSGPVVSILPVGAIWMFHSVAPGTSRVRCGLFGRDSYTFEVLRAVRLELSGEEAVVVGKTVDLRALAFAEDGTRVTSDVRVDRWVVTGPVERDLGDSSCEFPPWCGGPGPAGVRLKGMAPGTAKVEAFLGDGARGERTLRVLLPAEAW